MHEKVYDEFVEKAKARAMKRAVGDPFKVGVEQGPQVELPFIAFYPATSFIVVNSLHVFTYHEHQIDAEQFGKILKYIRQGKESGATLEAGGGRFGSTGFYIQPTVFSNVKVYHLAKGYVYYFPTW